MQERLAAPKCCEWRVSFGRFRAKSTGGPKPAPLASDGSGTPKPNQEAGHAALPRPSVYHSRAYTGGLRGCGCILRMRPTSSSRRRAASSSEQRSFFSCAGSPMKLTSPPRVYPPVGFCIYCGTRKGDLRRENIIPFGLGGNLILPKASCRDCERERFGVARMTERYLALYRRLATAPARRGAA